MPRVLITGARGFVGRALCRRMRTAGWQVRGAMRGDTARSIPAGIEAVRVDTIEDEELWRAAMSGVNAVVHLAARVHVLKEVAKDPLTEFRRTNVQGTAAVARAAARAGVTRFVAVSTIGVNGSTSGSRPFRAEDEPAPATPYAVSKWEAEGEVWAETARSGLGSVVVRPPLVYGPHNPGNFLRLIRLVHSRVPLPLASIRNRRGYIFLDNLVDFLACCVADPRAAGETFLVCDREQVSTPELIRRLAKGLGSPSARLFPFPPSILRILARLAGRGSLYDSLCGSLEIDAAKCDAVLGWTPPIPLAIGLAQTTRWYTEDLGAGL